MSPPGNLYASTLVRLTGGEPPAPSLALVAAISLHEAVNVFGGHSAAIKWPNDLLIDGAKLSGILLERSGGAVVVGIGVNLAHHPETLDRAATSLAAATGSAPDPDTFLTVLADSFALWLYRWRSEGLAGIRAAWLERAHPVGTALQVRLPAPASHRTVPKKAEVNDPSTSPTPRSPTSPAASSRSGVLEGARDVMPAVISLDPEFLILHGLFEGLDESGALMLRLADGAMHVIHAADVFLVRD